MEEILKVSHLSIDFMSKKKWTPTVTDVSFSLNRGELLAMVGESGCGKSVTCMSLARLLPFPPARISSGEVLLKCKDGTARDILRCGKKELRKIRGGEISYIFQEPSASLNPVFSIGSQIEEAVFLHRPEIENAKAETINLLKQVGIPDPENRANQYPHELSGGMQQRVMIAMALASNPSVLIADEPTTALDVTIQAQILNLLNDLRRQRNMSVILVTHNLGIVAELSDRVAVMYAGRIVEYAKTGDLLKAPCHPYSKALISAVPVLGSEHQKLNTIRGAVPSPAQFRSGCRFAERCEFFLQLSDADKKKCVDDIPEMNQVDAEHYCSCRRCNRE